jgi:hypothetical protein
MLDLYLMGLIEFGLKVRPQDLIAGPRTRMTTS